MSAKPTNQALVRRIRTSLSDSLEWTETDELVLQLCEMQAADLDRLEASDELKAIREARNQRLALCRLIGQLDLPQNARSSVLRARKAASARWNGAAG
jgi:hypothetical protein